MIAQFNRRGFLASAMALALTACDAGEGASLRASLAAAPNPDSNGVWIWLRACLESLRQAGVTMNLSANGALGREEDRTEMTGLGLIQINDSSISEATALSDLYVAAQLPFLFEDLEAFDRLFSNAAFMSTVNADLRRAGVRLIDAAFLGGMSGIFTSRQPVRTLSDMKGLRLSVV